MKPEPKKSSDLHKGPETIDSNSISSMLKLSSPLIQFNKQNQESLIAKNDIQKAAVENRIVCIETHYDEADDNLFYPRSAILVFKKPILQNLQSPTMDTPSGVKIPVVKSISQLTDGETNEEEMELKASDLGFNYRNHFKFTVNTTLSDENQRLNLIQKR